MGDEEQPAWLRGSNSSPAPPAASNGIKSDNTGGSDQPTVPYKRPVQTLFLIINLGMAIFMAATGALGVGSADSINDTGNIFVGIYMVLFAAIEFIFEVAQFCPGSSIELIMQKNFGFLYGTIGKSLYILFMGVLAFGLSSPRSLALACGIIVAAWGPTQILVYFKFPGYFDKKEKYQP